jgi:hypothetical protein
VTTGKGLRDRQRRRMFKAQDGRCWWCSGIMLMFSAEDAEWTHPAAATREHVVPVFHGGKGSLANTRLTHRICNEVRGSILDEHDARRHVLEQIGGQALMYMRTYPANGAVLRKMVRQNQREVRKAQRLAAMDAMQKCNTGERVLPEVAQNDSSATA